MTSFRDTSSKTPQVRPETTNVVQFSEIVEAIAVDTRKQPANLLKAKQTRSNASRNSTTDEISTSTSAILTRKTTLQKGVVNLEPQKPAVSFAQKKLTGIGLL